MLSSPPPPFVSKFVLLVLWLLVDFSLCVSEWMDNLGTEFWFDWMSRCQILPMNFGFVQCVNGFFLKFFFNMEIVIWIVD